MLDIALLKLGKLSFISCKVAWVWRQRRRNERTVLIIEKIAMFICLAIFLALFLLLAIALIIQLQAEKNGFIDYLIIFILCYGLVGVAIVITLSVIGITV